MRRRITFLDELPGMPYDTFKSRKAYKIREQSKDLWEHADELRANPMKWAMYPRPLSASSASRMSQAIRDSTIAAYRPDEGFECACREGVLFLRWNPDETNYRRREFKAGYDVGVHDTIEKYRRLVWEFRKGLGEIDGQTWNERGPTFDDVEIHDTD